MQKTTSLRSLRRASLLTLAIGGCVAALVTLRPQDQLVPDPAATAAKPPLSQTPLPKSNLETKSALERDGSPAPSQPAEKPQEVAAVEPVPAQPALERTPAERKPVEAVRTSALPAAPWTVPPGATINAAPEAGSLKPPFLTGLDDILKPVLAYPISEADIALVKDAVTLVYKDEFDKAKALMAKIGDATARKLVYWYILRGSGIDTHHAEIIRFRQENPHWPSKVALDAGIEAGLLFRESNPDVILAHFRAAEPQTGAGKAALGGALIQTGEEARGRQLIGEAWRRHLFDQEIEAKISGRFGKYLTGDDHKSRLNWLLATEPKKKAASIQRLRKRLKDDVPVPKAAKAVADQDKARAAKLRAAAEKAKKAKAKTAAAQAAKQPATKQAETKPAAVRDKLALGREAKQDVSLILTRIRDLRRKNRYKDAWSLLRSVPKTAVGSLEGEEWWSERRIHVRMALNQGFAKTAYDIAQNHGLLTGQDLAEAEFLAGWIALRFLKQPDKARDHFAVALAAGGLPKEKARSGYWLGRAELALDRTAQAEAAFREAARHHHTFYGQLAEFSVNGQGAPVAFRDTHRPAPQDVAQFYRNDAVRAMVIAEKAGLDTLLPVFLYDFARYTENRGEMALIAELALRLAPLPVTVRFAKIAINRGFAVDYYAFPASFPEAELLLKEKPLEISLLHALTRQESEFNPGIVSPAGARGLMQLMPATAKMVAKNHGLKYELQKLKDPVYNVRLGTAFLQNLVNNYDGSYIMALAAYNAGPGRVRQWVGQFGDPRKANIDPIDWIERIPFTETRDYVHKIMESVQMYRAKFNQTERRAHLARDVFRGRTDFSLDVMQAGAGN